MGDMQGNIFYEHRSGFKCTTRTGCQLRWLRASLLSLENACCPIASKGISSLVSWNKKAHCFHLETCALSRLKVLCVASSTAAMNCSGIEPKSAVDALVAKGGEQCLAGFPQRAFLKIG